MTKNSDVFDLIVVGAGPAGLTAGKMATDLGLKVLIVDSDMQVGGISKTVWQDGFGFDLGGHRFFTKVKSVEDFWGSVLDSSDFLDRPRKSRIFYNHNKIIFILFCDYHLQSSRNQRN
jgi:protoporphyrinogen oxidase